MRIGGGSALVIRARLLGRSRHEHAGSVAAVTRIRPPNNRLLLSVDQRFEFGGCRVIQMPVAPLMPIRSVVIGPPNGRLSHWSAAKDVDWIL
ncbi:hypothetical protein GCM10027088_10480 [Nocardia goodfellowii]